MPRYFGSYVCGRPLAEGGRSFIFEPVEPQGGSWLGVLAVEDDAAANILAAGQSSWEITEAKYTELKKKASGTETSRGFVPSQTPRLPPLPVQPSARPAEVQSITEPQAGDAAAVGSAPIPVASTTLKTTSAKPPLEPLIDLPRAKERVKKAA